MFLSFDMLLSVFVFMFCVLSCLSVKVPCWPFMPIKSWTLNIVAWFSYRNTVGDIWWLILISIFHRWVQHWGVNRNDPRGPKMDHPPFGCSYLVRNSAVIWFVMWLDSLNGTLWVRFYGWYWYHSFLDGSNVWGVNKTYPWGSKMDQLSLVRSYLVIEESCYLHWFDLQ